MKSNKLAISLLALVLLGTAVFLIRYNTNEPSKDLRTHQAGPFKVQIELDPSMPKTGKNQVKVTLNDNAKNPVEKASLRLQAEMQAMGAMPKMVTKSELEEVSSGVYKTTLDLSMRGTWNSTLHIEDSSGQHAHIDFDIVTGKAGLAFSEQDTSESVYTCPMHPSVKSPSPGACPICGMDLTLAKRDTSNQDSIFIDESKQQLIGVTKAQAKRKDVVKQVLTVGNVKYDETTLSDITLKFNGWIDEVYADFAGKTVNKGEPLFTVYSPELVSAQKEYIEAISRLNSKSGRSSPIVSAAKQRLRYSDLTEKQINQLEKTRKPQSYVPILAPRTGVIIKKEIVSGSAVKPGMLLYRISDLSKVWVEAELYDEEIALLSDGTDVSITLPYLPDKAFSGQVTFIYPYLFDKTRTGRVRVVLENPKNEIRPGTYSNARFSLPLKNRLIVPKEAVIFAGETRVVFVDKGEGNLQAKRVKLGVEAGPYYEVLEGIEEGDTIVTSGNFLIASEAKIKLGIEKW